MIAAIRQRHPNIDNGKAERTARQRIAASCFDRGEVLARHGSAMHDFVKDKSLRAPARLDVDDDVAELTMPTRLLLMPTADRCRLANGLTIRNGRLLRFDGHAEARRKLFQRDAYMHFALAEQLHLAGGLILHETQRRVLFRQFRDRCRHADFVLAVANLQRQRVNGLRRRRFRQCGAVARCRARFCIGCFGIGEGFTRRDMIKTAEGDRVAFIGARLLRRRCAH